MPAESFARIAGSIYNSYAVVDERGRRGGGHVDTTDNGNPDNPRNMAGKLHRPRLNSSRPLALWLAIGALLAAGAASDEAVKAPAEDVPAERKTSESLQNGGPPGDGRLIRVRLPLVGNADAHIKSAIQRAMDQFKQSPTSDGRRPILILELVPARRQGGFGEGTDFERAVSLARYLTSPELSAVKTIAYIPALDQRARCTGGHGVRRNRNASRSRDR